MCRVLIINSPLFKEKLLDFKEDSLPPIGLGYIATYLQEHFVDVELIDSVAENLSISEIMTIIEYKQPQFIGINIFSTNIILVKEIVESVKVNVNFIIGGLVTRHIYKYIIEWKTTNHINIIIGEGEYITYDIINNNLKELPIAIQDRRSVYKVNKDSIYFPGDISHIPLNRLFFKNEPIKHSTGFIEANISTSRGCIYNCAFCGAARNLNCDTPVRERTHQSIIDEINTIISIHPKVNSIRILDDIFLKNKDNILKAIKIFKSVKLSWRCMAHLISFKNCDIDILKKLKESGCRELFIGIESGSVKVLKMINKTNDLSLITMVLNKLFLAGINIKCYFILGFPGETEEDLKSTYRLASTLKQMAKKYETGFRVSVFQYRPYHGTKLYNLILKKYGGIAPIRKNNFLSTQIGRRQFNFTSKNYSNCDDATLIEYIRIIHELNNLN